MRKMWSPTWVVSGLVEPLEIMITPASCSASAAGMAWVVEIGPSTASTPSSMKRLAQRSEERRVGKEDRAGSTDDPAKQKEEKKEALVEKRTGNDGVGDAT